MSPKKSPPKSTSRKGAKGKSSPRFTVEEQAALRERAQERKEGAHADGEAAVLAKIAELPEPDRTLALRIDSLIRAHAPALSPKTWYGMPAYARDGKVVCFFQSAHKFKTRYASLGFSDAANLDDGPLWPTVFAVQEWTAAAEAKIVALVKKAVS